MSFEPPVYELMFSVWPGFESCLLAYQFLAAVHITPIHDLARMLIPELLQRVLVGGGVGLVHAFSVSASLILANPPERNSEYMFALD